MQVTPADVVSLTSAQASTSASVRVVAGNLASIPLGTLLQAVVTQVTPRDATLELAGQSVTVRPPLGLQAGAVLLLRVPNSGAGTLDVVGSPRAPKPEVPAAPAGSAQVKVVDVLEPLPDGRVRVSIDGQEQTATARDPLTQQPLPLTPGSRAVLEVVPTPAGPVLRAPAETPSLPQVVATAILRATPTNDLTAALKPLQAELTALVTEKPGAPPLPAPVREAAVALRDTVRALVPAEPRPPSAEDLQALVENGGLHFEAKLARVADAAAPTEFATAPPEPAPRDVAAAVRGDLKGDLLRLLQSSRDLGTAVQLPAARAALDGIEGQQAAQTLAQATGTPYILQVPFPDRDQWRTLQLSVEPEDGAPDGEAGADAGGRFRLLMHVPLSELGETWIDAGLAGDRFRAAIYLDRADVRDRVAAALPELQTDLSGDGFAEVLLDVRATAELPARARERGAALRAGRPVASSLVDVRA